MALDRFLFRFGVDFGLSVSFVLIIGVEVGADVDIVTVVAIEVVVEGSAVFVDPASVGVVVDVEVSAIGGVFHIRSQASVMFRVVECFPFDFMHNCRVFAGRTFFGTQRSPRLA